MARPLYIELDASYPQSTLFHALKEEFGEAAAWFPVRMMMAFAADKAASDGTVLLPLSKIARDHGMYAKTLNQVIEVMLAVHGDRTKFDIQPLESGSKVVTKWSQSGHKVDQNYSQSATKVDQKGIFKGLFAVTWISLSDRQSKIEERSETQRKNADKRWQKRDAMAQKKADAMADAPTYLPTSLPKDGIKKTKTEAPPIQSRSALGQGCQISENHTVITAELMPMVKRILGHESNGFRIKQMQIELAHCVTNFGLPETKQMIESYPEHYDLKSWAVAMDKFKDLLSGNPGPKKRKENDEPKQPHFKELE